MKIVMHETIHRWLAGALIGLFTLVAQGAPGVLQVGTSADYPPLVYQKDGAVVGMEADFARLLGAQLGKKLQFKILPATDLLPALEKGEVDLIMSGWRITTEREQRVLFADSYLQVGLMAIIRTDDVGRFHNPAALLRGGYRAAVVPNTEATDYIGRDLGNVTAVPVADAAAGLLALQDKRADVFIGDASSSWNIATDPRYGSLMSLGRRLTEEPVAWAVNKNHPELRDQLNRALQTFRQTGVLEHIYNRWIPMSSATSE